MPVAPSPVPSEERAAAAALDDAKAMTRGDVSEIDVEGMEEGEVDVDGAAQEDEVDDDGVRIYDRSFLLKLQFTNASVMRPTDLPELPDIVLDEVLTTRPHSHKQHIRSSLTLSFVLFEQIHSSQSLRGLPNIGAVQAIYRGSASQRGTPTKRPSQGRGPPGGRGGEMPRKVISIHREEAPDLHKSKNAYKVLNKSDKSTDDDEVGFQFSPKSNDVCMTPRGV